MATQAWAVPAKRVIRTVDQGDGTSLSVVLCGDEHFHCFATSDGLPLVQQADGTYAYARIDSSGALATTGILAHEPLQRSWDETAFLTQEGTAITEAVAQLRKERMASTNASIVQNGVKHRANASRANSTYEGSKRGLVILVEYSNRSMTVSDAQVAFNNQFNETGYSERGHIGSVHDYFLAQSYGKLDWTFDVVGPYTLSNTLAYYGTNDALGIDQYLGTMIAEACQLADEDVDFSQYDWDGDGEVDQVFVIYAGYGENAGAASNTIWPCMSELSGSDYGSTLTLDGVTVNTFACSCELAGTSGSTMDGIGVACHEFSHCLGLPDLYDTSTLSSCYGMATWSILDSGNYLGPEGNGEVPCAYTGYERMYAGWLTPVELDKGTDVSGMKPITDGDSTDVYILYNDGHQDEFYILENRQLESWDAYGYGHGLLVVHVDYVESYWESNTVNNYSSHQCCTVIPADNDATYTITSLAGDPYPGTAGNTSLTSTSTPAATLYNANSEGTYYMTQPITDIAESDEGDISFVFNSGIDAPVATEATDISSTAFTAHWEEVDGADSYVLTLREVSDAEAGLVVSEDFSGFSNVTNTNTNYASTVDKYLSTSGWTATRLYSGYASDAFHGVRLGSASYVGTLTTPLFDAPSSGAVTLRVDCEAYDTDDLALSIGVLDTDGNLLGQATLTEGGSYVLNVPDVSTSYQAQLATSEDAKRAYVNYVALFDGTYSLDELTYDTTSGITTYEGIVGTSYAFSGLSGHQYYYGVQAQRDSYTSESSNTIYVELTSTTAIGHLPTETAERGMQAVYTLSGIRLPVTDLNTLPHGTYILRTDGGETMKVAR